MGIIDTTKNKLSVTPLGNGQLRIDVNSDLFRDKGIFGVFYQNANSCELYAGRFSTMIDCNYTNFISTFDSLLSSFLENKSFLKDFDICYEIQESQDCNKNQDNDNLDTSNTKQEQETVLEKSNIKQEPDNNLEKSNKKQKKLSHGGKRAGAGRKKTDLPTKPMRINQYERDLIEQLRTMNGDVKQNVKRLIKFMGADELASCTADEMGLNKEDVIKGNMTK
ncbi:hypothetical protein [Pseudoalteromonas spongiae]|uniref:hypothetical protein n=1 Tax=Pseudoalteromonas spongiae TaxID=298657 RepID=UPI000C2D1F56|nr:hypothetical protein [Pseudoalteromonas spongiae]